MFPVAAWKGEPSTKRPCQREANLTLHIPPQVASNHTAQAWWTVRRAELLSRELPTKPCAGLEPLLASPMLPVATTN